MSVVKPERGTIGMSCEEDVWLLGHCGRSTDAERRSRRRESHSAEHERYGPSLLSQIPYSGHAEARTGTPGRYGTVGSAWTGGRLQQLPVANLHSFFISPSYHLAQR
jgi:hypothetical protein